MNTIDKLQQEVEELVKLVNEIKERAQARLDKYEAEKAKDDEELKPLEEDILRKSYTIEAVLQDRKERDAEVKEALDTLYMQIDSNGGKPTGGYFLTAYKAVGVECELISEDVGDDDKADEALLAEAGTGWQE